MKIKFWFIFLSIVANSNFGHGCEISMFYKKSGRLPFMEAFPSNKGLLLALYSRAMKRINCKLIIERPPKGRGLLMVREGEIDFIPSKTLDPNTDELYFSPNGLYRLDVSWGIGPKDIPPVKSLKQVKDLGLAYMVVSGDSDIAESEENGIPTLFVEQDTLEHGMKLIQKGRRVFFDFQRNEILYYIKKHHLSGDLPFTIHKELFEEALDQHFIAFSTKSKHIKIIKRTGSFEMDLDPNCMAYKLLSEIKKIYMSGELDKILKKENKERRQEFFTQRQINSAKGPLKEKK